MNFNLHLGDCLETLKTLPDCSVDSVITDPPYGLSQHTPQQVADCLGAWLRGEEYKPKGKGFMGKSWDAWVPSPAVWRECLRVLKPGGHLLAFAGTRSMDLMSMAVRLAGFELRDSIGYAHDGGGAARFFFRAGHEKEDLLFCRAKAILSAWKLTKGVQPCSQENASVAESSLCLSRQAVVSVLSDAVIAASRGDRLLSDARGLSTTATESECERLCETLITAMLISESVALPAPSQDVLIQNGCHVNVAAIQKPTDTMTITISLPKSGGYAEHVTFSIMPSSMAHGARGLNDRFRYCAKASKKDRDDGNIHPTVKPTALMRYLCRLVTPPSGTVLDPFTGSGSTGKAAILEGFNFIGCEMQPDYHAIAHARISAAANNGDLLNGN